MRRTLQWFFIFLFLLAVGIASGSFFEVFLYGAGKASLAETLNIFLTTPQEMRARKPITVKLMAISDVRYLSFTA